MMSNANGLPTTTLGRTGLPVTQLGYGAMEIRGPRIWGFCGYTFRLARRIGLPDAAKASPGGAVPRATVPVSTAGGGAAVAP